MHDDDTSGYGLGQRVGALLGLLAIGMIAFILADVASGGKITRAGCGCQDTPAQEGESIAGD
jgi:hypothetical protein